MIARLTRRKRGWTYHTCDECGDVYPSIDNSIPQAWRFDPLTGRLTCDACLPLTQAASRGDT